MTATPMTPDAADAAARRTRREWDGRVDSWEIVCRLPAFGRFRDVVLQEARLTASDRLLDVGAGTGLLALAAAPRVASVTALDLSPGMVERLSQHGVRKGLGNVQAIVGDARRLAFPTGTFDVIVSCYALHHVDDAGKREFLREAARVLTPGGRLVLADMMFALSLSPADRAVILTKCRQMLKRGPAGVVRLLRNGARMATGRWEHPAPPEWWQAEALSAGFAHAAARRLEQEAGLLVAERTP